jgi:hypothetical protein
MSWLDWLVSPTASAAEEAKKEAERESLWLEAVARIEAGVPVSVEELPEEPPPPAIKERLPPEIQARYPQSFFERNKTFIVAGGILAGILWWRGRKK